MQRLASAYRVQEGRPPVELSDSLMEGDFQKLSQKAIDQQISFGYQPPERCRGQWNVIAQTDYRNRRPPTKELTERCNSMGYALLTVILALGIGSRGLVLVNRTWGVGQMA